jgi:hypothetical protein
MLNTCSATVVLHMADKPKTHPPPPRDWIPSSPPIALAPPRHYVKATACGKARKGHSMTTDWNEVNCAECLDQAPFRKTRKG